MKAVSTDAVYLALAILAVPVVAAGTVFAIEGIQALVCRIKRRK